MKKKKKTKLTAFTIYLARTVEVESRQEALKLGRLAVGEHKKFKLAGIVQE